MIDCDHNWNNDKETRFCLKCGQVRTFPNNGDNSRIVWQGKDDKRNPLELDVSDKRAIAVLASLAGIKATAQYINIETKILRGWAGAYNRKPKEPKLPKEIAPCEPIIPQVLKSPLSTKVSNSDFPSFPIFNDNWVMEVQLEWLKTYLELVKYGQLKAGV